MIWIKQRKNIIFNFKLFIQITHLFIIKFRLDVLLEVTTQKIVLGEKGHYLSQRNSRNEFQKIINSTDKDTAHKKKMLDIDPKLCRYKDIYPYAHNSINIKTSYNDNEKINASWMHVFDINSFIATQGPNDETIDDFWTMCFKYKVNRIIMLCQEYEDNKKKCSNYWGQELKSNIFEIKESQIINSDNIIEEKKITVYNKVINKTLTFPHIQFKAWPDHKIPDIQNYVPIFTRLFNFADEGRKNKDNGPILVHCSAGIGRTGVFLTLYGICHEIDQQIKNKNDYITFNIFNFVRKLKEMRMYSVENINQYNFIYRFLKEYLDEKNIT